MTPPPDSGGQINPFGMPPLADAGRLNTEHIGATCTPHVGPPPPSVTAAEVPQAPDGAATVSIPAPG
jgi:hypothetical protein